MPNIGELLSHAWSRVCSHFGLWAANFAIATVGLAAIGGIAGALFSNGNGFLRFLASLLLLAGLFAAFYGLCSAANLAALDLPPSVREVWKFDRFGTFVREGFLWVAVGLGCSLAASLLLPLFGGLVVGSALMYWPFFALNGKPRTAQAIWGSIRLTNHSFRDLGRHCLLALFAYGVLFASTVLAATVFVVFGLTSGNNTVAAFFGVLAALLWLAATIATIPTAMVSLALTYRRCTEPSAAHP